MGVLPGGQIRVAGADDDVAFIGFQRHIGQYEFLQFVRIVGQGVAGQVDGAVRYVLHFHPVVVLTVILDHILGVGGHDFRNDQLAVNDLIAPECQITVLSIGIAGGGNIALEEHAVGLKCPGPVLAHSGNVDLVDDVADRAGEHHGAAFPGQGEVGFALRCIAAGAGNHQTGAGGQGDIRQSPLRPVRGVIGQEDTGKIHRGTGGVVDLNPVAEGAVLAENGAAVGGHDLADDDLGGHMAHGIHPGFITGLGVFVAGGSPGDFCKAAVVLQGPGALLAHFGAFHLVDGVAVGTGEDHGAAIPGKGEIGFVFFCHASCTADDRPLTGFDGHVRYHPLGPVLRVVGEECTLEGHGLLAGVIELNPVGLLAFTVYDAEAAAGSHLADDQRNLFSAGILGLEPGIKASFRILEAGGGVGHVDPVTLAVPGQRYVVVDGGHGHLVNEHVGTVVQADDILALFGNAEIGIGGGFTVLHAPAYDIAVGIEDGAPGEGVANGVRLVAQHVSGDIDGHVGGVVNFNKIQELAVWCRIGPVAGQDFADDDGAAAVSVTGTRREYQRESHSSRK